MPSEPNQNQPADFQPLELAARLMKDIRIGTLATLEENGAPLATLTTIALDEDGVPLIFISSLSAHTQNLLSDPRFSLLLAELGKGDPLAHPRVSLSGVALQTSNDVSKARFIAQNPKAKLYSEFADFSLWRLVPDKIHLNGGFARAYSGDAQDVLNLLLV
jgi:heme iron utilization protein